jgi:DNA-binding GntR family transcriptional regulator
MKQDIFDKIPPSSVKHKVIDLIRDAIIRGDLPSGEHLTEVDLAKQMVVSRAPIREALRQLELEGLVTSFPNRGCFVTVLTEQDAREIFSLRATLESMAIESATPHLTATDFRALREFEAQQQAILVERFDELTKLDMRFHEYICIKANNSRMLKAWYAQIAQCQMLMNRRFRITPDYSPGTVISDHTAILDVLERRDLAAAINLIKSISERVQKELTQILKLDNGPAM